VIEQKINKKLIPTHVQQHLPPQVIPPLITTAPSRGLMIAV
jgi:hypothetical protein